MDEDRSHLTPNSIRLSMGTLLDVIQDKVYPIHQSLKDFFQRFQPWPNNLFLEDEIPRLLIAKSCIIYLGLEDFNVKPFVSLLLLFTQA